MEAERKALDCVVAALDADPGAEGFFARQVYLEVVRRLPAIPHIPFAPDGTPETFFQFGKKAVMLSVELILVRDGAVLLTYRKDRYTPEFTGWHFPGTYREPRKPLIKDAQRCATNELGPNVRITSARGVGFFDHTDSPRFHDACWLIRCEFEGEPHGGGWFSECPPDLIGVHQVYWPVVAEQLGQ